MMDVRETYKILLVDDEEEIRSDRSEIIRGLGYDCIVAGNGKEAINLIERENPDVVLTDQKMPEKDGFAVLEATYKIDPDLPVIFFTGFGTVESAVKAMKDGAFDYLQKPFSPEMMGVVLNKAIEFRKLKLENVALRSQIQETYELKNVVYESPAMRQIAKNVYKLAKSDANVLIFGESGTGKELIARSIHFYSSRKEKPFIPLDCIAIPVTLLESELFGFEKGAFTGAIKAKPGVFELAEKGTLFLDEITEMDYHMQAKLLRVLQERQFRRIGGKELIEVDVRVISATNRDPEQAVKDNKLREDVYYRLNVVPIYIPPLRERKDDIPLLVQHFISKYNPFSSIEIKRIDGKAMKSLKQFPWPGNVRELENVIHRIMSLTDHDTIELKDLPDSIVYREINGWDESLLRMNYIDAKEKCVEDFSIRYLSELIKECKGNISEVARQAGISRKTLYRLINTYRL